MRVWIFLISFMLFSVSFVHAASMEELFEQAQTAFKAGDFEQAGELFTAAGDQLQKSGDAEKAGLIWGNAAVAYIKGENWAAAADLYEKILATNKRLQEKQAKSVYKNLVLCRGNLNQRALQIAAIERMLKALPNLPSDELADVYARQGDAYRAMELYGPAVAAYSKAAKILSAKGSAEQKAKIMAALGLCQGNLGDYAAATKSLEEANKLAAELNDPVTLAESDSNLGILYWERGDYPKAMELIGSALEREKAEKLRRSEGIDRNNLGLVYKAVGKHQTAMAEVEQSIAIAREVKNERDEAIATVNRALIYRIGGELNKARADYNTAMKLFEKCGFQEGTAGALLGIGRMEALENKNYTLALANYKKALDIYSELSLLRGKAETLLQLGEVYKYIAAPGRTTRDLVFDDEPTLPEVTPDAALEQSRDYFTQAMELAKQLQSKEMIWSAHQGLGYADLRAGRLEDALKHYEAAIDIVTSMYLSLESVELLGEYMAGKEDLYSEAQEVCAALYDKTKDKKYLDLQMKYAETLRNEVQKASAALVQMQFEDPSKQALYEQLCTLGREQNKAARAIPVAAALPEDATPEQKAAKALTDKAIAEQEARVQKLDGDYKKLLAQWKKKYPGDAVMFESVSKVDAAAIQKHLSDDQIVLQYIAMNDKLMIISIDTKAVNCAEVEVTRKDIEKLIRDDFLVTNIEKFGRAVGNAADPAAIEKDGLKAIATPLAALYGYLVKPVEAYLAGKKRIYPVTSGFMAQLPFAALVSEIAGGQPRFLVEDYEIAYLRPTFVDVLMRPAARGEVKKLLGVANPMNEHFQMPDIGGTVNEVGGAYRVLSNNSLDKTVGLDTRWSSESEIKEAFPDIDYPPAQATESWLRKELVSNSYEIFYLATHGMPYSNVVSTVTPAIKAKNKGKNIGSTWEKIISTYNKNLASRSPLNGFLYLSSEGGDDILAGDISEDRDGLWTIKEILQLPETAFSNTKYVILSACNTGVTLVPNALAKGMDDTVFDPVQTEKELHSLGWIPGIDQVSFVESFMRRGVYNVYATFWQADDGMSSHLMSRFTSLLVEQGDAPDAAAAYSQAQREVIAAGKKGESPLRGYSVPQHPYYWAVGGIFGK